MGEMRRLLQGYETRVSLSLIMTLIEAVGWVLIPFVIGVAIDEYLKGSLGGLVLFALVGLLTIGLSVVRRLHDARLYAQVYERAGTNAESLSVSLSARTAQLNMLREAVDFVEYSLPILIESVVILTGSLIFLATLNQRVLMGALVVVVLITGIYAASTGRTRRFNHNYNDEYERQVDVLDESNIENTRHHIRLLNRWTIKLSDIDAINFGLSFSLAIGLLIFAIVSSAAKGVPYGALLSIVLYVLEFSGTASLIPNAWQESLRLQDILTRLNIVKDNDTTR